jgi:hypothetical protein
MVGFIIHFQISRQINRDGHTCWPNSGYEQAHQPIATGPQRHPQEAAPSPQQLEGSDWYSAAPQRCRCPQTFFLLTVLFLRPLVQATLPSCRHAYCWCLMYCCRTTMRWRGALPLCYPIILSILLIRVHPNPTMAVCGSLLTDYPLPDQASRSVPEGCCARSWRRTRACDL